MQLAVCEFARNVLGWKGEHELGRWMRLLPHVRFQSWMNVRRATILIRCSFVVFRRQFYWIQSWIQVPCGQVSFAFCSILVRLSSTGMNWIGCLVLQVIEMPEHNPGQMGGTMRLGKRRTVFKSDTSVMSMETLKANIQLLLFALLQCLINNFYRKALRECGFYRREAQTQIWSTAFFIIFFHSSCLLHSPRSIPSVDIKTLLYCLHRWTLCWRTTL